MAINQRIFDSAISNRTYCGRAVSNVNANGIHNLFLVHPDGNLYALAIKTGTDLAIITQSSDNGFTWEPVTNTAWTTTTANMVDVTYRGQNFSEGLFQGIFKNSFTDDYYFITIANGQIWFYRCSDATYDTFYGQATVKYGTFTDSVYGGMGAITGDGDSLIYMAYTNTNMDLKMIGLDVAQPLEYIPQDYTSYGTTNWCSGLLAAKSKDALVHTLAVMYDIPDMLCYCPYTKQQAGGTGHFSGYYMISSGIGTPHPTHTDLAIDIDGLNNLCAVYSRRDNDTTTGITGYYAISNDAGVTWTNIYNNPPTGYSGYIDPMTHKATLYNDVIGGASGSFLMSSIYMKDNSGTLFVKEIPSVIVDVIPAGYNSIIVANSGVIQASGSTTWHSVTSNTNYNIKSVTHNGSLFVGVGDSGLIVTSPNTVNWTTQVSNTTQNLNAIAYNGSGMLCAIGNSGTIVTSTDGVAWTSQTSALATDLYCITKWNPVYMWCIGSTLGTFQTSINGSTWISRSTGQTSYNWYGLAANTTTLVAVAEGGIIRTTANGTTWSNRISNVATDLNSVEWTGTTFVACADSGKVITNPSGTSTWTTQVDPTAENLNHVKYLNGKVNLFGNSNYYATSINGSGSWSTVSIGITGNSMISGYFAGSSYSSDDWRRVNTVDGEVIGGKFFKYMNEAIPEFGNKSSIRMVYQVGEINNNYGADTVKSRVYQERLTNLAYPLAFSGTAFTKDDIDYYASGYINKNTTLYIEKINELGMVYSISRYEPSQNSEIIGIGAYEQPTIFETEACVDPGSYGFATVARNNSDFSDYIERDTRKIFYKPNVFLERNFILNKGGYLKRTIYTIRIMGNDYELAQIVPRFLDGSILYYEANLYVIGPSNDPFKKVILPSES